MYTRSESSEKADEHNQREEIFTTESDLSIPSAMILFLRLVWLWLCFESSMSPLLILTERPGYDLEVSIYKPEIWHLLHSLKKSTISDFTCLWLFVSVVEIPFLSSRDLPGFLYNRDVKWRKAKSSVCSSAYSYDESSLVPLVRSVGLFISLCLTRILTESNEPSLCWWWADLPHSYQCQAEISHISYL